MADTKLSRYRAKRDFTLTEEPQGSRKTAPSGRLRYVIQKHAARRLHYDLRLELDGVFKSWAVTRGPSLNPADKRLAVEVEDHPLDYGDFEGTIPAGQYGGGTVQLWDRGYWRGLPGYDGEQALRKGELKFELDGERLHGEWVLVRMRHDRTGGKRTNWLLIKHRDGAADPAGAEPLLAEDRSVASGRSMAQIEKGGGKAPTAFMTSKARFEPDAIWQSKAVGGAPVIAAPASPARPASVQRTARPAGRAKRAARTPMPTFIEPQLCTLVERPPDSAQWAHEIKLDGYRLQLRVQAGRAALRTRKGLDWTDKFPAIAVAARDLPDCLIDGEVVALDANGHPSFAALQAALSESASEHMTFYAFDLLWREGEDLRLQPLRERKQQLQGLLEQHATQQVIRYVQAFEQQADTVWKSACRMDLEGIVSKRLDAPYRSGRTGTWTKAKCRTGHEVVIGGYTHRAGGVRSLLVGVYDAGRLRYVGRVGTGFGLSTVKTLQPRLKAQASDQNPFRGAEAPKAAADVRWVKPVLVAEIEFAGWTGGGMVRQAAFKGVRDDKPAREVRAELPSGAAPGNDAQSELAAAAKSATPARRGASPHARATPLASRRTPKAAASTSTDEDTVAGQRITHPDKVLWPDAGDGRPVTKLDLARYLESVGEWMVPHIEGRPCSLVRMPDGLSGEKFFQRHAMQGMSKALHLVRVSGDRQPYVQIDSMQGLLAAAQIAALELHPWNCLPAQPDVPGRFVFDLDPAPDVAFNAVIDAALELKTRLEKLGLTSFCKTTGGKGLHVVVPLSRERKPLDWPAAKTFTQAVCAQMASDSPSRYLTTMAKKDRTGRIFLDYLRNDRMATAVAPLSPRAREGATVSMPLNWPQVKQGLEPKRYSVRSVPALLTRDQPWKDYARASQSLRSAVEKLTQASDTGSTRAARPPRVRKTTQRSRPKP